ncbi:unnamed protein product, partial [Rotaria sordida]
MVIVFSRLKDYVPSFTVHPNWQEVADMALNAANSFGAIDINDLKAVKCFQGFMKYASYAFPSVSIDKLIDLTYYFSFYWLMDNYMDDKDDVSTEAIAKLSKATLHILERPLNEDGNDAQQEWFGIVRAQYSILQKMKSTTPSFWFKRFMRIMKLYLNSCATMYAIRIFDKPLDYDEYVELRLWESGVYSVLTLYEYAFNIYLPDNIVNSDKFKRAIRLANSH